MHYTGEEEANKLRCSSSMLCLHNEHSRAMDQGRLTGLSNGSESWGKQ